jgi:hypothetical protein
MEVNTLTTNSGRIQQRKRARKIALLGYCVESMEAAQQLGYEFVAVVPPGFAELLEKDGIAAYTWDYDHINENSHELGQAMQAMGVSLAVPLYEETVEWAGALNGRFFNNPRLFNRSLLFRDKAMMKRKAQMSGIRVGVFEEVDSIESAKRFWERVNEALVSEDGAKPAPVHLKPKSAAGSVGHYMIRNAEDLQKIPLDSFPCLAESHLHGQEFSCEVFIHDGQIRFMNINEYIHLGYSQLLPPTPKLEKHRPKIRRAIEKLISAFEIRYGVIHPEYFLDADKKLNFGEVASRIPGGHIFELIERAYGFDAFAGQILCADPDTSEEELASFFPDEIEGRLGHAGNLLVYPKKELVRQLAVPAELEKEEYYLKHNLFEPLPSKVGKRVGFGNHYGKVDFFGADPTRLKSVIEHYEKLDFYD